MDDHEILQRLLDGVDEKGDTFDLPPKTREAFRSMQTRATLTERQARWVREVAAARGLIGDPGAANLFSGMPADKQARQRAAAAKVRLPWER